MTTLVKYAGVPFDLGGQEYIVPPLALGDFEQLETNIMEFDKAAPGRKMRIVCDCAVAAIKRNYPDITEAEIKPHIDIGNFADLFMAIMSVSGVERTKGESPDSAGKPEAAAPIGAASTPT